ncbi:hypothetical protein M0802_000935 [Mischocyttarus mexicanus]|nr:hypothetical protein M0802_000935 [Mischocyttarus mexicanus]
MRDKVKTTMDDKGRLKIAKDKVHFIVHKIEMATTSSQQYSIRWNNYHSNLLSVFDELLLNAAFADVTLCLDDGRCLKCHKVVLAACSTYFQDIFYKQPYKHIVVALKDVDYCEIKIILEYMYRGEIHVAHEQLEGLLKLAKSFKIKGLLDIHETSNLPITRDYTNTGTTVTPPAPHAVSSITSSNLSHCNIKTSPNSSEVDTISQGNIPQEEDKHPYFHYNFPTPFFSFPTPNTNLQSTNSNLGHSSTQGLARNISEEIAYDDNGLNLKRRKRSFQKYPMVPDTPILRTVLNQRHIESCSIGPPPPPPPSVSSDSNEARSESIISLSERGVRENTVLTNYDNLEHSSTYGDMMDEENKQPTPPTSSDMVITHYNQKPEWKRYKQYTREDIKKAIDAVRTGMSALQASRMHGVPSRTLYDKVKKLGIANNRPSKRGAGRPPSSGSLPVSFGGNSSNNYGTSSSANFGSEYDDESNSTTQHDNTSGIQPETGFISDDNKVIDDSIKLTTATTTATATTTTTTTANTITTIDIDENIVIKEEIDDQQQYSNYDDEIQDLSMNSKNTKAITQSNIDDKDSDNLNRSS